MWCAYLDPVDEHIIPAVLSRVVGTAMAVYTPVAGEGGRHALCTRTVCVAVEESEVRRYELWAFLLAHPQVRREVICSDECYQF